MKNLAKTYVFQGFGFDVVLKNVILKSVDGEEYPDINLNELKTATAKALLSNKHSLTGYKIKFLRTFLKMSFDEVSHIIHVPASTLRSWENKGSDFTGLSVEQEKAFRIMSLHKILEEERTKFDIELTLTKEFKSESKEALELSSPLNA